MSGRRKRSSKPKKSRRSRKKTPRSTPLLAGGAVTIAIVVLAGAWLLFGRSSHPAFDEARALSALVELVSFGPRAPGSAGHATALEWMTAHLESLADEVSLQEVTVPVDQDTLHGTNVIASFNLEPEKNVRVMLGAHWDTRPWADQEADSAMHSEPIPGANDGGSGVAVLLEIARILKENRPDIGVDILLFDLEDSGRDSTIAFTLGSEFFAANSTHYRPTFGIIVDMVCDGQLRIPREFNSNQAAKHVVDLVWEAADDEGADAFLDEQGLPITDDHVPFLQRRIPVIDLIHAPFPPYWHTMDDTIENCQASSLGQVGNVLLRVIYEQ